MPVPVVTASLIAAGVAVASKIADAISNKIGKNKAEKIAKRAVALQNKSKRSAQEEKELKELRVQYPIIGQELDNLQKTEGKAQLQGNAQQGYPAQELRFQKYTPEQQQAMNSLLSGSLKQLGETNLDFAPFANEARRQFSQEVVPSISSRFSSSGGIRSGAYPRMLAAEKSNLDSKLAALGSQYNLQKYGALSKLLEQGLQPQYASSWFPGQMGTGGLAAQSLGQTIGNEGLKLLSNPDILTAFTEWYKNRGQTQQQNQNFNNQDFTYTPQLVNPGTNNVNSLNAMQAVMNPTNLTANSNTNNGFYNPINPSDAITNQQAAQFLYGLR